MSIALLNRRLGALGLLARIPAPAPPAVGAAAASSASANRGAPRPSPRCSHSSASSVSAVAGSPSPHPWRRPDAADDDRRPRYSRSPPFLIDASASPSLRAFSSSSSSSVAVAAAEGGGGDVIAKAKLYVGNLPPDATPKSVRELFEHRLGGDPGKVLDCFLSRGGYAFVTVPAEEARDLCGDDNGGLELGGRMLRVDVATPRDDRKKKENDDGGPVVASSVFSSSSSSSSSAAAVGGEDLKRMSLGQLADMRTIPGWDLVHNPPRKNPRGALVGTVVSDKMQKTVNVAVDRYRIVPKYRKRWKFTRKFMAHDDKEVCNEGDLVMIVPCQKISRHKHFMVSEIIRRKGQL